MEKRRHLIIFFTAGYGDRQRLGALGVALHRAITETFGTEAGATHKECIF
jgi:hypothetical protein